MTPFYRAVVAAEIDLTQLLTEHGDWMTPAERRKVLRAERDLHEMVVAHTEERDMAGPLPRRRSEGGD